MQKKTINDVTNLFRLEKLRKDTIDNTFKDIRSHFRLKKRIIIDIMNLFEHGDIRNSFRSKKKVKT